MRHLDLSPLYRSTVGFDRVFSLLDTMKGLEQSNSNGYPPYNIERTGEDTYRITMAVAGFGQDDITIELEQGTLKVVGAKKDSGSDESSEVLYRGIAERGFERRFQLADHVEVSGADIRNGLLHIDLKREIPEAMKPRRIAIGSADNTDAKTIEHAA